MKSLKKKGFLCRLRMPHVFTLLFAIIVVMGVVSLILAYSGVANPDTVEHSDTIYSLKKMPTTVAVGTDNVSKIALTYDGATDAGKKGIAEFGQSWTVTKTVITANPILGAGIMSWIAAPIAGMLNAAWIIIFLLVLGGFIYFVVKSQALEALMGRLGLKLKGIELKDFSHQSGFSYYLSMVGEFFRHTWMIFPLVILFAFFGTSYGMAEESLAFYAIMIPLTIAAGFDMWTGFLIIFAGAGIGVMGSTINPFSVISANDAMVKATAGTELESAVKTASESGAAWRWVTWTVLSITTALFVMSYAFMVKRNQAKGQFVDMFEAHKKQFGFSGAELPALTKRRIITAVLFLLTFVILVLGMLQWDKNTGTEGVAEFTKNFENEKSTMWFYNTATINKLTPDGYDWFFGAWWWTAIVSLFLIATIVIAIINRNSEKETMDGIVIGAKDMIGVAFAVGIARGISMILKSTGLEILFANEIANVLKNIKGNKKVTIPVVSYILFIPLTFFIPSTSGLASATFGVIGNSVGTIDNGAVLSGTVTAYAMGAGFANMFVPTYAVVIGAIGIAKISYSGFLKAIWKFLGLAFVMGLIMLIIGGFTPGTIF